MQADMEIQSAAKLRRRHLRRDAGTGARSRLKRLLFCNSANCPSVNSFASAFIRWPENQARLISELSKHPTAARIKPERQDAADLAVTLQSDFNAKMQRRNRSENGGFNAETQRGKAATKVAQPRRLSGRRNAVQAKSWQKDSGRSWRLKMSVAKTRKRAQKDRSWADNMEGEILLP